MNTSNLIRVILLDDDETILSTLSEILTIQGYEVYTFSSPAICPLQKLPECRCSENQACTDVIISDLDMPGMDGLSFIENQKEKGCKCRNVAIISGRWTDEERAHAHEIGCKTFEKPFPFEEFYAWLNQISDKIEPTRQLKDFFKEEVS